MGGGFHLEESGCDQIEETVLDFSTLQLPIPKTFTIQAKVTDAASTDETAAVALLTAFKTAAATMRGGIQDDTATDTNAALALTFTEVAGASAMTTFAVAIAAVAALF